MLVGLMIMALALVGASLCSSVTGPLWTQGVLYAIGCIVLYMPRTIFLDKWFIQRRGLCFWHNVGRHWSRWYCRALCSRMAARFVRLPYCNASRGGGHGTVLEFVPVLTQALTRSRIVVTIPCLFFDKPRSPSTTANAFRPRNLKFLKSPSFWLFQTGNIGNSLGCFIPSLWMPVFAIQIGLPTFAGPLSLAFYNGGYSAGAVAFGLIADKFHVSVPILISAVLGMISALVFWGLANTQAMLYTFAVLWEIFVGGFNSTWPGCASAIRRAEPGVHVDTGIFLGLMAAGRGIGGVVSGPLSERLLDVGWKAGSGFAYGTSYGVLVAFCSVTAAFDGTACVGRLLKMI